MAGRFLEALSEGPRVVDGAMGSQLFERGVLYNACLEELNVTRPALIRAVHEDYVRAGATLIETNTFGANAMRLDKHGLAANVKELNEAGVKLAREAVGPKGFVVGAIGPSGYFLGEAAADDLRKVRGVLLEQARALVATGHVDALVVETFRQTNELRLAVESACQAVSEAGANVPVIASASVDEYGRMADGTTSHAVALLMKESGASVVGINCSDGPMNVLEAVQSMLEVGLPVWAVPNAGLPRRVDERLVYVSTPEYFGVYARRMFKLGVSVVGGCCGTTPEHVKRMAAAARMMASSKSDAKSEASAPPESDVASRGSGSWSANPPESMRGAVECKPFAERSRLASKLARGAFVVSVEVNPPVGLSLEKSIAAAMMLERSGIDVVNIADGARAQARMGNLAMAVRVQERGVETILHVCGRDRNLLATLAHLLAANELGIKNLVVITGDPPKMGDFPDASAVYDLDSIGILKLAARLNDGIDPGGKPLGSGTSFVLATGAEPAALNYEREIARLRLKKEAGAELVMTQPVYDAAVLEKFLTDIEPLGLPVLVGLLPLASYRNAEFLHNEVPGMQVPEHVRERMRKAGSGPEARKVGVAIAREMLARVRSRVAGAYVMPPFERFDLALEVVEGFTEASTSSTSATAAAGSDGARVRAETA